MPLLRKTHNPTPARPFRNASASSTKGDSAPGIGDSGIDGPPGPGAWIPGADRSGKPLEIRKPEPPEHNSPLKRSEGVMAAALIYKLQPQYPAVARTIHLQGTVYLRAIIATDGTYANSKWSVEIRSSRTLHCRRCASGVTSPRA